MSVHTPVRPGEAYGSPFVFEVPAAASKFQLAMCAADEEDALLWGLENSPLHKKIIFSLGPKNSAAATKSS
jgi:hypothetical protein